MRNRPNRNGDRPPRFNKYEEGGGYGRKEYREGRNRRRDGDREGGYKERNYDKDGEPRYRDGDGNRERKDRNGRRRDKRPRDGEYESRGSDHKKQEFSNHNPKLFFNSKKPKEEGEEKNGYKQRKPSNINR